MFSKSCKYALRAVLYLAANTHETKKAGAKLIAETLEVPQPFLSKILQQLARHKLIASTKGPNGGFYLDEEKNKTSLRAVIECIEGPEIFTSCILGLPVCSAENPCPLHNEAVIYRKGIETYIANRSIEAFVKQIHDQDLRI